MKIPVIRGLIDRRVLVNFHADPVVVARVLPPPFRPKTVKGYAVVGICLIRLKNIRPRLVPSAFGISSENAAHRFAVEWGEGRKPREGVFIPRRDTNSRWNVLAGGRLFPGVHHHARFRVYETDQRVSISLESEDREVSVDVVGDVAHELPGCSAFSSLAEASAFFEGGSLGYSATESGSRFDGLELRCKEWHVEPLSVERVKSSFFCDARRFPPGSVEFDCALLMRGIEHEWHTRDSLCCEAVAAL